MTEDLRNVTNQEAYLQMHTYTKTLLPDPATMFVTLALPSEMIDL